MTEPVNPRRRYNSPRRREQAAATRREILEAASGSSSGRATRRRRWRRSRPRPASRSRPSTSRSRPRAASCARSGTCSSAATRSDVPVAEQTWYREMLDEPDPERQLRLNARNSRAGKLRVGARRRGDPRRRPDRSRRSQALWDRIQTEYHENQRAIVESLAREEARSRRASTSTAPPTSSGRSTTPTVWQLLVGDRGWTPERTSTWSPAPWTAARSCARTPERPLLG